MCVCLQPDDVEGKVRKIIPAGFTCNTDDFVSLLEKEANFKPFGTLLHTYTVHNEEAGELTYQIHKVQARSTQPLSNTHHHKTFSMWEGTKTLIFIICVFITVLPRPPLKRFIFTQLISSFTEMDS